MKKKLKTIKIRLIAAWFALFSKNYILIRCKEIDGVKYTAPLFRTDFSDEDEYLYVRDIYQSLKRENFKPIFDYDAEIETALTCRNALTNVANAVGSSSIYFENMNRCCQMLNRYVHFLKISK